jgi:hypothetical protein
MNGSVIVWDLSLTPSNGGLRVSSHSTTLDAIRGTARPFDAVVGAPSAIAQDEFFAWRRPPCAEASEALMRSRRSLDSIVDEDMPRRRALFRGEAIAINEFLKAIGTHGPLSCSIRVTTIARIAGRDKGSYRLAWR